MHTYAFYNDFSLPLAMVLCAYIALISGTAASICMCDTPWESLLNNCTNYRKVYFAQWHNKHPARALDSYASCFIFGVNVFV